jgi:chemotaxis protein MotB
MAGGGGAWKVAYADFVTAMMAFFMVMWLTSQKPELKEAVSEYFRNPSGKQITGNPNQSILPSRNDSSGGKRTRTRGKQPIYGATKMTDEGKRSNIGTMIQFDPNSVNLSQEGESRLKELLPELVGKPHRIEVRGHAVNDTSRGENALLDSLMISYRRSLVVFEFLSKQGVEPERMRLSQAGGSEPRFVGQSVDPNANARVELYLLDETYEPPAEMMKRMVSSQSAKPPTEAELAKAMEGANVPAAAGGHGEEAPKDKHKGGH